MIKHENQKSKVGGSITVFLSLILLLILSLILTTIEGARVSTAKTVAQRALFTAMDSVLADFYAPLMEEYHILGLDTGYGTNTVQEDCILDRLQEYMSYTFSPNQNFSDSSEEGVELYDISTVNLSITDRTNLMDHEGELFINEAVEYMKYEEIADGLEVFMNKMSMLESPQKVSVLYEEKTKVEEELVAIDEGILTLMNLLDGVKTSEGGLVTTKDGALKISNYFVKKICLGEISKEQVGINNDSVFQAVKGYYVNPMTDFEGIEEVFSRLEGLIQEDQTLIEECSGVTASIESKTVTLDKLNEESDKTKEIKAKIKKIKQSIEDLESRRSELQTDIAGLALKKNECSAEIQGKKNEISIYRNEIINKINASFPIIDKMKEKSIEANGLIMSYENHLYEEKDEIEKETFLGLEDDLLELKKYITNDQGEGYDFEEMKNKLEADLSVLTEEDTYLEEMAQKLTSEEYSGSKVSFQKAKEALSTYQIEGLTIDYSSLVISKKEDNNPLSMIQSLINDGILGLVVDPNTISEAELTEELLPSVIAAMEGEDNDDFGLDITSLLKGVTLGETNNEASNIFASFGQSGGATSSVGTGMNAVSEHLLFQEYLLKHFPKYQMKTSETEVKKPSVLTYEQEYILVGKRKDMDNLSSVVSKIVFIRTVMNFMSILGDRTRCNEARITAAALVGFTGLPILVSITKMLILIIWAFAEALVDTSALLQGKEVPFMKSKSDLVIKYTDLFMLNRVFIETKASQMKEGKGALGFTYQDYLRIFLFLMKKEVTAYRAMDLIQENIRIRYEDTFSLQNCMFGFTVNARFHIQSRFLQFSFVKKILATDGAGYNYEVSSGYSY